jgi:hypothetical protein
MKPTTYIIISESDLHPGYISDYCDYHNNGHFERRRIGTLTPGGYISKKSESRFELGLIEDLVILRKGNRYAIEDIDELARRLNGNIHKDDEVKNFTPYDPNACPKATAWAMAMKHSDPYDRG